MSQHFILKCLRCQSVVKQCRCPSKDKEVRWQDGCSNCLKAGTLIPNGMGADTKPESETDAGGATPTGA